MKDELFPAHKFRDDDIEIGYRKSIKGARGREGETEIILALELERKGGACPLCGIEWRKIDVQNRFANFFYFQPACGCYPICRWIAFPGTNKVSEGCGRYMVAETFLHVNQCLRCIDPYLREEKKSPRKLSRSPIKAKLEADAS